LEAERPCQRAFRDFEPNLLQPGSKCPGIKPIFKYRGADQRLLAVLLDTGGAQSGKTMLVDGELPGKEFVHGQRVAAASLLKGEQTTAHCGNDFGLTADDPPFSTGRWQIRNC